MNKPSVRNPWGLTPAEVDVMDDLCRLGRQVDVAKRRRLSRYTVRAQLQSARQKMGIPVLLAGGSALLAAVQWTIWRQGGGKDVPA
mgnify:CR=1 FL=1